MNYNEFKGETTEVHETYDLNNPEERVKGYRALIAFFLPIMIFVLPAVYFIVFKGSVFIPVVLIIVGVCLSMILTASALIYNEEHSYGEPNYEKIEELKVTRSVMIIIFLSATYIPFLNFIVSLIFAKKHPNSSMYGKGFNVQIFSFIWSLISLAALILVGFLSGFIRIEM